jgi:flagellin-like protein
MNFKKLIRKRRAVSPILAAVLLIGLAITAGAVLFIVVIPLITAPGGGLGFDETATTVSNTAAHVVLKNTGTESVTVTDIDVFASNSTDEYPLSFTFVQFSVDKGQGAIKDYTYTGIDGTITQFRITLAFEIDGVAQTALELIITP